MVQATSDHQPIATGVAMGPSAKPKARRTLSSLRTSRIADVGQSGLFRLITS